MAQFTGAARLVCGILGEFSTRRVHRSNLDIAPMRHRGPDSVGSVSHTNYELRHCRLEIQGIGKTGDQPMLSKDGRFALSYNGEIYNHRSLRRELQGLGHVFMGTSDTEVLLRGWEEWGESVVSKLNGMFAFAMIDVEELECHLGRDRFGVKPLYFTGDGINLKFSSEIRGLRSRMDDTANRISEERLATYFHMQNLFPEQTFWDNVHLLKPGTLVTFGRKGSRELKFAENRRLVPTSTTEDKLETSFEELIGQVIPDYVTADVPVNFFLSGGLDSSALCVAGREFAGTVNRFISVGFPHHGQIQYLEQEHIQAQYLADSLGVKLDTLVLGSGDVETKLDEIFQALEEPRVGQSYPNFFAYMLAAKSSKAVIAGTGGDEIFGGYPWRIGPAQNSASWKEFGQRFFQQWSRLVEVDRLPSLIAPIGGEALLKKTKDQFLERVLTEANGDFSRDQAVRLSMNYDSGVFLHGLLMVEDKVSMWHSVESRLPMLDNRLVDFGFSLPPKRLFGERKGEMRGKLELRRYLRSKNHDSIVDRPKKGFSGPDEAWFRDELWKIVERRLISNKSSRLWDAVDKKASEAIVWEHRNGRNHRLAIWSLLHMQYFLDA